MEKGPEFHARELELYTMGNRKTMEVCKAGETGQVRALKRPLLQQWEDILELMTFEQDATFLASPNSSLYFFLSLALSLRARLICRVHDEKYRTG